MAHQLCARDGAGRWTNRANETWSPPSVIIFTNISQHLLGASMAPSVFFSFYQIFHKDPFYGWGNRGREKWSNSCKATQIARSGARVWTRSYALCHSLILRTLVCLSALSTQLPLTQPQVSTLPLLRAAVRVNYQLCSSERQRQLPTLSLDSCQPNATWRRTDW